MGKGYFDRFGLSEGLSQSTVNCIFQDSYGFLWIGTEDGLNRFDGYQFEVFQHHPSHANSISNNVVYSLYEDSDGVLWIGTASGLNRYDRFNNSFEVFRYRSDDSTSISDNTITALAPAGESGLWVGTRNGLNLMEKESKTFRVFKNSGKDDDFSLTSNLVNDLSLDKQGRLWCATEAGLNLFDPIDSTFLNFTHRFGDSHSIPHGVVNCLDVDQWGNIWVGTEAGLAIISPALEIRRILDRIIPENESYIEPVRSIMVSRDYLVWVGSATGLLCLDDKGAILRRYEESDQQAQGLFGGVVQDILEDRSGAVWIGTLSGGLFRYNVQQQIFEHFQRPQDGPRGLRNEVSACMETAGDEILVGGSDGLLVLKPETGTIESVRLPERSNSLEIRTPVKGMLAHNGRYYLGLLGQGLVVFDEDWNLLTQIVSSDVDYQSLGSNHVTCLLSDDQGLWLGTQGGGLVFVEYDTYRLEKWKWRPEKETGLPDNHVTSLARDERGNLWVGTANRGLSLFNPEIQKFTHFEHDPEKTGSLSSNQITALFIDTADRLWVATRGGGLNLKYPEKDSFESFRSSDGLPANTIAAMVEDSVGMIWASTTSGLVRIDLSKNDFRKFNEADGLKQLEFIPAAAGKLSSGDLWFGSANGLVCVKSEAFEPNTYSPPPVFTQVQLSQTENGIQVDRSIFPRQDSTIELEYGVSTVHIEFALLNLIQADKNTYAYTVEGLSSDWIDLGNQRRFTLANPEPGTYKVKVKGTNYDGIRNPRYSELKIVVHPAIWQTASFRFLVIISLMALVYLLYRWRVASIKSQNKMLELIVDRRTSQIAQERDEKAMLLKEIHHRVKNNLQIISSLLNIQSRMADDPKVEDLFLESINRVQSMSMIHEKMYRTENLKEIDVRQYIGELVEALVEAYAIGAKVNTTIEVEVEQHFAVDTLTPLGLIINELVSNSLKYAFVGREEGTLFLRMTQSEGDTFQLVLSDDGIGFDESDKREGGFGTELVEDLAGQLQGSIEKIEGEKGTTYRLTFKDIDNH